MESIKRKNYYAQLLSVVALCSWTSLSLAENDDYTVTIYRGANLPGKIWYGFFKTNVTGKKILSRPLENLPWFEELPSDSDSKIVPMDRFPALKRDPWVAKRLTQYTRLFVSIDEQALRRVLNGFPGEGDKEIVVSARVPQKLGSYCSGKLGCIVNKNKKDKLFIKFDDQRICTREGSDETKTRRDLELRDKNRSQQPNWPSF